jgi:predicted Zn-dependent protease
MTRDRLSRRGPAAQEQLSEAHARALVAAPNAVSAQDYERYVKLLRALDDDATEEEIAAFAVDPEETARAVAAAPADPAVRATHALALLKAGRPQEAVAVFDDLTVFFNRVPPGQQAVICLVLAEGGQKAMAIQAAQVIEREMLMDVEKNLLQGLD